MGCYSDSSSTHASPGILAEGYGCRLPWPCDAEVLVLSGKLAVNATANKTNQIARNPQLE
jgi:hypothetical protein